MKLNIIFSAQNYYAVSIGSQEAGLGLVDKARADLGLPKLALEVFDNHIAWESSNPAVEVTESVARSSGLFESKSTLKVCCTMGALNRFMDLKHEAFTTDNGEVTRVRFYYKLDTQKLIQAWADAGYPTEWGISDDEKQ